MFCSRSLNNLINRIHECALRLIHDHVSSFQDILEMTKEKTIHQNNLESLAKEIYKFLNGLSPPIMNDAFMIRNNKYNLRNFTLRNCTLQIRELQNAGMKLSRIEDFKYGT